MRELRQKLNLWRQRLRTAQTDVLREVALMHIAVYADVIRRRLR